MITLVHIADNEYYVDGEVTNDDFFLNTESEHFDGADAESGKDAAVYSVTVSLKQAVLDTLAKSKHVLESGVIGSFECTRLIQLVSMKIDAERSAVDGENAITPESCDEANRKLRLWQSEDMDEKVDHVKRQLCGRLNFVIESNNRQCLQGLFRNLKQSVSESQTVADTRRRVESIQSELNEVRQRLSAAMDTLSDARKDDFLEALKKDPVWRDALPESAVAKLNDMANKPGVFADPGATRDLAVAAPVAR